MLYYSNGGPGPATKLLRVDAPSRPVARRPGAGFHSKAGWLTAPSERWTVKGGWKEYTSAQADIIDSGDYSMVDAAQVPIIQQEMRDQHALFH